MIDQVSFATWPCHACCTQHCASSKLRISWATLLLIKTAETTKRLPRMQIHGLARSTMSGNGGGEQGRLMYER